MLASLFGGHPRVTHVLRGLALATLLVGAGRGYAQTAIAIYVNVNAPAAGSNNGTSWDDAYTSLQSALAQAAMTGSPGEIWVAAGTYKPTELLSPGDPRSATFTLVSDKQLYGGFVGNEIARNERDPEVNVTILSGDLGVPNSSLDNCYHVVKSFNATTATCLDGFTITGGKANGPSPHTRGGGLWLMGSDLSVGQCKFIGNTAIQGGGVYMEFSNASLTKCLFSGNQAVVNGFSGSGGALLIVNGNPSLSECTLVGNAADVGGGLYVQQDAGPGNVTLTLTKCTLLQNAAANLGGGVYAYGLSPDYLVDLDRCRIIGNTAGNYGGGIYLAGLQLAVTNSVLIKNVVSGAGGGAYVQGFSGASPVAFLNCTFGYNEAGAAAGAGAFIGATTTATIANCVLWGDPGSSTNLIANASQDLAVSYCNVQGGFPGVNNIAADPRFLDFDGADNVLGTADDNLRLASGSPCVDAGSNAAVFPFNYTLDLQDAARFVDDPETTDTGVGPPPVVDMGAYEFVRRTIYVKKNATGANNGMNWCDAFDELDIALDDAAREGASEIWVAAGTYHPSDPNGSRTMTFQLQKGTAIYGGFVGGETLLRERDPAVNVTILSGDLNEDDGPAAPQQPPPASWGENSFHVVTGSGTDGSAVLDGFTITAGNANACCPNDRGGGVQIVAGSPIIRGCRIAENAASATGGGMSCEPSSRPHVVSCDFDSNRAVCPAATGPPCQPNILPFDTCVVGATQVPCQHPDACAPIGGGGVNCSHDSPATFVNCRFVDNYADTCGGAVVVNFCSPVKLVNCLMTGNVAGMAGGAFCEYLTSPPVVLTNCTIRNNVALGTGFDAHGGGLYVVSADTDLANCIVWGNSAFGDGKQITLYDTPSQVTAAYCDIQNLDTSSGVFECNVPGGCVFTQTASVSDFPAWTPDSFLLPGSPCIDAGDSTRVPADSADVDQDGDIDEPTPRDVDDQIRFVASPDGRNLGVPLAGATIVDIGAYEFLPPIDCNRNGVPDFMELYAGALTDCNDNEVPDTCDDPLVDPIDLDDCDEDGASNLCEIANCPAGDTSCRDCNDNRVPDECDLEPSAGMDPTSTDCNGNTVPDECDIAAADSIDCNSNAVPDECDAVASVVPVSWGTAAVGTWSHAPNWCPVVEPDNTPESTFVVTIARTAALITLDVSPAVASVTLADATVEVNDGSSANARTLISAGTIENAGVFRATDRERLVLDAPTIVQTGDCDGGRLEATDGDEGGGGTVDLAGDLSILEVNGSLVIGGLARAVEPHSEIHLIGGAELMDVCVEGVVVPDGQVGKFSGAIMNEQEGGIKVGGSGAVGAFLQPGSRGATLMGGGGVKLANQATAHLGDFSTEFVNAAGHAIFGQGIIFGAMTNSGVVRAIGDGEDARNRTLTLFPPGPKVNLGVLEASDDGMLRICDALQQSPPPGITASILAHAGGEVQINAPLTQGPGARIEAGDEGIIIVNANVLAMGMGGRLLGGGLLVSGGFVELNNLVAVFGDCIDVPPSVTGGAGQLNLNGANVSGTAGVSVTGGAMTLQNNSQFTVPCLLKVGLNSPPAVAALYLLDDDCVVTAGKLDLGSGGQVSIAGELSITGDVTFANTVESDWVWGATSRLRMKGGMGLPDGNPAGYARLEVGGRDLGTDPATHTGAPLGFINNFDLTELVIGPDAHVCLVDLENNGNQIDVGFGSHEALYVDKLTFVDAAGRLNLNDLHVYFGTLNGDSSQIIDLLHVAGDYDGDGGIDLVDFNAWPGCWNGPNVPVAGACAVFDFDLDADVDLRDFAAFAGAFGGP